MANTQFDEMYDAIYDGDCEKIDTLIRTGLSVNSRVEGDEWNFLHIALVSVTIPPNPDVIRHLINLRVDVNARDKRMWTPLHFAVRTKNRQIVKMLIDASADVDPVNDEGISPLHLCLLEQPCDLEVAKILLAAGADPDNDRGGGTVRNYINAISGLDNGALRELLDEHTGEGGQVKYFYYDAATCRGTQSAEAIKGNAEDISAIWKSLSQQAGSFLGVYSSTGVATQFIWDDSNSIIIDIPSPARRGSMTKRSSFEECAKVILNICSGDDPEKIQGLEFVEW